MSKLLSMTTFEISTKMIKLKLMKTRVVGMTLISQELLGTGTLIRW